MSVFRGRMSHKVILFAILTVSLKLAYFALSLVRRISQSAFRTAFVFSIFLIPLAIFLFAPQTSAAPTTMNFQGRLADSSGNIMPNGLYNMQFRLFTVASGGAATWTETRETTNRVQVTNGLFSVQLGAVTPLSASLFSGNDVYFEITLPTPGTATCGTASCASWESAMTPRHKMATSAYAFQAENANTLDGLDSGAFAQLSTNNAFTGTSSITTASANAFTVGNASNLFRVDTSASQVVIGTSDTTGSVLVLDTKTDAGDPTGTNGAMYYSSNSGKFRCYQAGTWADCITSPGGATLQSAYNASGTPATITTTAAKGLKIQAGSAPTADLFSVDNTGQAVVTDNVNGIDVNYVGGAAAVEGAGLRVDYVPGATSGGTWSGVRIVADATGAVSGVNTYGLKIEGPSSPGAGTETGIRVAGGFDIGVDIASGSLQMAAVTDEPSAPTAGNMKIYAKDIAGRMMLKTVGPSGLDTPYQPALFANNIAILLPSTGTTINTLGMPNSTVGTASTPSITTTNLLTSMRRVTITSAATANSASELRAAVPLVWRGNSAGLGGFFYASRFSTTSTTANQRLFSGLTATTGATNTSIAPSAIVNMLGVGWDSADANLHIMHNDGSGTATKVDLGSSFPANTTTAVYELILYAAANGSSVGYRVQRLDTGAVTSGTITTDMPAATSLLTHHQYMNNGGTAAAVILNVNRVYIESDY